ncbi:MAG: ABC transporter permease [Clostridium sp.]|uniref:ABC transporter permease n=1 Tax=Clostridium sp. TaxID=1506 RepID=UPI002FC7AF0F
MLRVDNILNRRGVSLAIPSIIAIIAGVIFGFIILLITSPTQALDGLKSIIIGGFEDGRTGIGQVIYLSIPVIMTGLSVGFAFKTGLFNIGAPGQFTIGAFTAVYIGIKWTFLPPSIHWIVAIIGAIIAGGIWGSVPGILKAYANVNEVLSCIMMNYIGMYLVNLLITNNIYDPTKNQTQQITENALIPKGFFYNLFPYEGVNISMVLVIGIVAIVYIVLNKTTFGYELKACGYNKDATSYAGINAKRNMVLSMTIAGVLSGIGGAMLYLSGSGKYMQVVDILSIEGFNGIPVALLGLSSPIGILFAGLFIGHITVGGINLQLFDFVPEIIDIIIASIIYFSALSLLFKNLFEKVRSFKKKKKEEGE